MDTAAIAQQMFGRPLLELDSDEIDAVVVAGHANLYPNGCAPAGHACDRCNTRLNLTPHKVQTWREGQRIGTYLGSVRYRCTECDYHDGS